MIVREAHRGLIALPMDLFDRLLRSGGVLESGQIANMRTHLLPARTCVHTRILGEGRTLCGRTWMPGGWQFCARGSFGDHVPAYTYPGELGACRRCARSPVLRLTHAANRARRDVLVGRR